MLGFLVLSGCQSTNVSMEGGVSDSNTEISEVNFGGDDKFRVGVLLPLSGTAAKQGQGLKNATMIALEDVRNPKLVLQYYDTKGTPEGARVAITNAINQSSRLIIGPLKSSSVQAISEETRSHDIPVIAFSTVSSVLQPEVYTLGLMVEEQVDRIVTYTAQNGRSRFALLIPDNNTGVAVARAAVKSAQKNSVSITRIGFYTPGTTDFASITRKLSDYDTRTSRLQRLKNSLKTKMSQGDAGAARVLERLNKTDTLGDVDFDAVLIPESGASLKAAVSMFGYYDVYAPQVKFIGTSVWENTVLNKESGETVQFLLQAAVILSRQLGHKSLRRVRRITGIEPRIFHILHTLVELFPGDSYGTAKVERIERSNLPYNHHHIVSRLVEHQQLTIPVINKSTRRILGLFEESVSVGILFVFVVQHLQRKQAHDIDAGNHQHNTAYDIFAALQLTIFSHGPILLSYPFPK